MSKTKKIIFWIFVGLICAGAIAGIVYTCMPGETEIEATATEAAMDSAVVDTATIVCDSLVVDTLTK